MTVRTAELVMAIAMALVSIGFMYKSQQGLAIGWLPEKGPGSGAWPFWLSAGMLLSCIWTIVRWFKRTTPQSRSRDPYVGASELRIIGITILALFGLLLLSQFIGMYIAIALFLLFYLRFLGSHGWNLTLTLALLTPTFLFFFFEWALRIPLPHGWSEPLFVSLGLYDIIYGRGGPGLWLAVIPVGAAISIFINWYTNRVPR